MVERTTVVDFVARGDTPNEWKMVLVEEGPWTGSIETELRRVQSRLYDTIDAALDGHLADKFPESKGKRIVIQLDCYNCPKEETTEFFDRFAKGVCATSEYRRALDQSPFVVDMVFHLNLQSIG